MRCVKRLARAFALYEVLLGVAIFSVGVLMLGRSIQELSDATALSSDEDRMRQILSNRMAEIQATPGIPDKTKETKIDTGFGEMKTDAKVRGRLGLEGRKGFGNRRNLSRHLERGVESRRSESNEENRILCLSAPRFKRTAPGGGSRCLEIALAVAILGMMSITIYRLCHEHHRCCGFLQRRRSRGALFRFHPSYHCPSCRICLAGRGSQRRGVQVQRSGAR